MPKHSVADSITDQEIAFARLLLSGTMNDRSAEPVLLTRGDSQIIFSFSSSRHDLALSASL